MATAAPVLQNVDHRTAYQTLFDVLGRAYWDASDIASKDLIHGAQEAVGEIISEINKQALADNTAVFIHLGGKIKDTNEALKKIQAEINSITRNLTTASNVLSAIAKVVSLFPV